MELFFCFCFFFFFSKAKVLLCSSVCGSISAHRRMIEAHRCHLLVLLTCWVGRASARANLTCSAGSYNNQTAWIGSSYKSIKDDDETATVCCSHSNQDLNCLAWRFTRVCRPVLYLLSSIIYALHASLIQDMNRLLCRKVPSANHSAADPLLQPSRPTLLQSTVAEAFHLSYHLLHLPRLRHRPRLRLRAPIGLSYANYRHQADACHAYQTVIKNSIPKERVILMMQDVLASRNDNSYLVKLEGSRPCFVLTLILVCLSLTTLSRVSCSTNPRQREFQAWMYMLAVNQATKVMW